MSLFMLFGADSRARFFSSIVLAAALLIGLGQAGVGSAQVTIVTDPDGVSGFKLQGNGFTWWSRANCTEFPNFGSAKWRSGILSPDNTVERDCNTSAGDSQAIRAGAYMYFLHNGQIIQKAVGLSESDPNVALDVTPHSPSQLDTQGTPLMVFEDYLYWTRYHTGASNFSMFRIPTDGGSAELLFTTTGARPIEMAAKRYDDSIDDNVLGLVWLEQNGTLRVFRDNGMGTSIATLQTGVADFDLHAVTFLAIPGGLTHSVSVYAAIGTTNPTSSGPPGRLDKIQISDGSVNTLFTASGHGQILSVATDSDAFAAENANVYIAEGLVSCDPECGLIYDTTQWRRSISGPGITTFIQYLNTGGGRNLESDDQWVYFNTGAIRRIASDAPPVQVDFSALGVEVVQNTQSLLHDVPLVSGKRTYARGYPGLPINVGQKGNFSISANLEGTRNGRFLPGSPLFSENNVTVDLTQSLAIARGNLANSFLWELPASWTSEGSITLTMTVDPNISLPETESRANNTVSSLAPAVFRPAFQSCLKTRPVSVTGAPIWSPDAPNAGYGPIVARASNQLPIAGFKSHFTSTPLRDQRFEIEWKWLPCPPFVCYAPVLVSNFYPFVFPVNGSPNAPDGDKEALDELDWWESSTSDPDGCTDIHWVGTVHPATNWSNGVGSALGLGRVDGLSLIYKTIANPASAPADFNHALGGRVLAHEIGHNHGRQHIDCGNAGGPKDNPPFGVCNFSSSNLTLASTHFGFDVYSEQPLDPTASGDLMSYAGTRWISAWNYQNILTDLINGGSAALVSRAAAVSGPQLLIRGHVDDLTPSATFGMAYLLQPGSYDAGKADQSASAAVAAELANDWRISILDDSGAELARVGVPLRLNPDGTETYFAQYVPYPSGADTVQLLLNDVQVAVVTPSDNAPTLTLLSPVVDPIQQTLALEWSASDADGDPLHFSIWYSRDGVDWQTLRMDYPGLSATFDTHFIPGSTDARVRVIATDGLRTAVDESAPFLLAEHDPIAIIAGLDEGMHVPFGDRVELFGAGLDAEDGGIPPGSMSWAVTGTESIADTGETLSLPRLLPGPYMVELTSIDLSAQNAMDTLTFEVDPLLVPDTTLPIVDGLCGDPAYANATFVEIPLTSGRFAQVRLIHAGGDLYACFTDAERGPVLFVAPVSVGLRVEVDGNGDTQLEPGDHAFLVNDQGIPYQLAPSGSVFALTDTPWPGVSVEVDLNAGGWGAEFRISEVAVGGWNHVARLQLNHIRSGSTPISDIWPVGGDENMPATWVPAFFGALPAPANRPPVSVAGPDHSLDPLSPTEVLLDGTGSFDLDGDGLTYQWTQTGGPTIQLLNDTSPAASILIRPEEGDASYLFELVVNDGMQNSVPDSVEVIVNPSQPTPVTSTLGPALPAFVEVGNPSNLPDTEFDLGAVDYIFDAGTTEVTNIAYVQFLNAVAASDTLGIFSTQMESDPRGGILRSGTPGSYSYSAKPDMETKPVNFVSWPDAARYVNWAENGAPVAPAGPGVTEDGSYDLSISTPIRTAGAIYALPSQDEWVKAGHFLGTAGPIYSNFTTQDNADPSSAAASPTGNALNPSAATVNYLNGAHWNALSGHLVSVASTQATSFYGTYDQGGNVEEWTDSFGGGGGAGSLRIVRGGSFRDDVPTISIAGSSEVLQAEERDDLGFRVFKPNGLPEPGLGSMLMAGIISLSWMGRQRASQLACSRHSSGGP